MAGSAVKRFGMLIISAAIVAIGVLGLLSLAFTLPVEFFAPADPDDEDAIEKGV